MGTSTVNPPVVSAKALQCPNCGGPVQLRGFAHTLNVVCPQCLTVLDASSPMVSILQRYQDAARVQPLVPLGSRGTINGVTWEAIGFQVRTVDYDGGSYSWSEYLLFNPYKGFRYLSEYNGHWNFIRPLSTLPVPQNAGYQFQNALYKHFSHATAKTSFVLGEFPWQVRVGETVVVDDYISPPLILSGETTDGEVTWSHGEYWTGQQIWQTFRLPGAAPPAVGIFLNQPAPAGGGRASSAWLTAVALLGLLIAMAMFVGIAGRGREVFRQKYSFVPSATVEPSIVTGDFDLAGGTTNVEIVTTTDLHNDWAYFAYSLVNRNGGKPHDFGRQINKTSDKAVVSSVPAGRYYLRIEPDKPAGTNPVNFEVVVRRGVPSFGWFWVGAILLLLPAIFIGMRSGGFESARWAESDLG